MADNNNIQDLFKRTEQDDLAQVEFAGQISSVLFTFDEEEAKGRIVIERSGYGAYIWVNGKCLGLIDLFHFSPEGEGEAGYPQIDLYHDGEDDALGYVAWHGPTTLISIDRDLKARYDNEGRPTLTYTSPKEDESG